MTIIFNWLDVIVSLLSKDFICFAHKSVVTQYLSSEMTRGQVTRSRSKFKWWKPAIPAVAISGKNLYMTTLRDVFWYITSLSV